jgi:hypothetical protein
VKRLENTTASLSWVVSLTLFPWNRCSTGSKLQIVSNFGTQSLSGTLGRGEFLPRIFKKMAEIWTGFVTR